MHTKSDIHTALLQVKASPLEPGLLSPAMLLFHCPIRGITQIVNRLLINSNNDDEHYEPLDKR